MKRTPRIYTSYFDYFIKRVIGPLLIVVSVFAFSMVYFYTAREAELAEIRAAKIADGVRHQFNAITTDQD